MHYEYSYSYPIGIDAGLKAILTVYLFVLVLIAAFGIVCCVFRSMALYTLAKRRKIHHPWLSWIPVGEQWILGSIADQYQYVVKNRVCSRRKVLLGLSLASVVLAVCQVGAWVTMVVRTSASSGTNEAMAMAMVGPMVAVLLLSLALLVVVIVKVVYYFIACNDLFTSCDPDTRVIFLVLGILFGVLLPFFFFADRKKDNGMPPRTDELPHDLPGASAENESGTEFL